MMQIYDFLHKNTYCPAGESEANNLDAWVTKHLNICMYIRIMYAYVYALYIADFLIQELCYLIVNT